MLKLFLWLRYLGKRKVVLLSIAAVAISCALLIVVVSLFNGFIGAFEQSAVDTLGDVVLSPGIKFAGYQELIGHLEGLESVEAVTATLSAQGLLHLGAGNVRAVEVWGIEAEKIGTVTAFERSLLNGNKGTRQQEPQGNDKDIPAYVGIGVLAEPDEQTDEYDFNTAAEEIGREIVLTTGAISMPEKGTALRGEPEFRRKTMRLVIADVVFTGAYYLDKRIVYVPIAHLQQEMYPNAEQETADQIHIKLSGDCDEEAAIAQIRGVWKVFASQRLDWEEYLITGTKIETARQMQGRFLAEVRKQLGILLLIFGVVSLSVVLLIFCIFYMIVETRRRDIAILKSCGAGSGAVALVFVGFGGCIGILGTAVGGVLGYFITKNINSVEEWIRVLFGLKLWKASVYMFSKIPNTVDWDGAMPIILLAIIAAAIGALIPAIAAARTRPVDVLRYE